MDGTIDPFEYTNVEKQDNKAEVLFATDRIAPNEKDNEPFYGNKRGHYLRLGIAEVRFGKEGTSWEDLKKHSLLKSGTKKLPLQVIDVKEFAILPSSIPELDSKVNAEQAALDVAKFAGLINERLEQSPEKDIYIYVSGYRVNFENPILVASELWHYMGENGVFIAYCWPATPGKLLAYFSDLETTGYTARNLRLLIQYLAENTDVEQIHILGYSAGTRIVADALQQLRLTHFKHNKSEIQKRLKIGNVILLGSDIDRDLFGAYFDDGFVKVPNHLTIYASKADKAMKWSRIAFGRPRLGDLIDIDFSPEVVDYLKETKDISMIDVTNAFNARAGNGHGYLRKSPWASSDVISILKYDLPPSERGLILDEEIAVWEFPPHYQDTIFDKISTFFEDLFSKGDKKKQIR